MDTLAAGSNPELGVHQRFVQTSEQAAALATRLAGELGVQPNLRSLVKALEKDEAQQLQAIANRDLRGVLTSWDLPTFWEHLALVYEGERGWIGWTSVLVTACSVAKADIWEVSKVNVWFVLVLLAVLVLVTYVPIVPLSLVELFYR